MSNIVYTKTDEAPALATLSLYPIIQGFLEQVGVTVELKDISLAARILAQFPDFLPAEKQVPDALAELAELVLSPEANVIKLPNISASAPQIHSAVKELQSKGFPIPNYLENPTTEAEREIRDRYNKVKGSAVNPVIREGNSDRRSALAVKNFARKNPHSMGKWTSDSKTHVSSMDSGDFYENEQSITLPANSTLSIVHETASGQKTTLKAGIAVRAGDIIDGTYMSDSRLQSFIQKEIESAKAQGVLFSVHLKATMMKVSDPIIFGRIVSVFFADVFRTYQNELSQIGFNPNNGLSDLYAKLSSLSESKQNEIRQAISQTLESQPDLAMVDSDRGITNLHIPNDVIIDASMPAAIRSSGKMWNPQGELQDMKAIIPDRSYARVYQQVINFCKEHGALNPATIGSVSNVGLMARKAEEYGSHDKTFQIAESGKILIQNEAKETLLEFQVEQGDIFRACHVDKEALIDWIELARKRSETAPAIFWLDSKRAHDREIIKQVEKSLASQLSSQTNSPPNNQQNSRISIMDPQSATLKTLQTIQEGKDIISVTGNVLRDYLTDLFPILELGTSAKMLSIIPLMNGGFLAETGAGGSAPKHVQQLLREGHLRWDSLGEFLALAESLDFLAQKENNPSIGIMAQALGTAVENLLNNNKNPQRKVHQLDNRGSHYYLALYWSKELAKQQGNKTLAQKFHKFASSLEEQEEKILAEINETQGKAQDIGGYFYPNVQLAENIMRASITLNNALEELCTSAN